MRVTDPAQSDTRERLLTAAGVEFADRGFAHATVRDICARAGANVAAVNYHFGDKHGLHSAVIARAQVGQAAAERVRTPAGSVTPPEIRLRAFIESYMERLFDENRPSWTGKLIAREMIEPTAALDEVVAKTIRPRFEFLSSLIREMLGSSASEDRVRMAASSVIGQCLIYAHCRPVMSRLFSDEPYDQRRTRARARHIADFSIAALRAMAIPAARPGSMPSSRSGVGARGRAARVAKVVKR